MQRLADELHISPGNLTYHFPKKEDLMLAIYDQFQNEMASIIPSSEENFPGLFDLDNQIKSFYKLQQRFLFFYLDLLDIQRAFKAIAEKHYVHIENQITAINTGLKYNVTLGYLDDQKEEQDYNLLAQQIWFTAVFWPRQVSVRGIEDNLENMRIVLWHLIKPYLTKTGESQVRTILDHEVIYK